MKERQSSFTKNSKYGDKDRDKWNKILISDMMSSEESRDDNTIDHCSAITFM